MKDPERNIKWFSVEKTEHLFGLGILSGFSPDIHIRGWKQMVLVTCIVIANISFFFGPQSCII